MTTSKFNGIRVCTDAAGSETFSGKRPIYCNEKCGEASSDWLLMFVRDCQTVAGDGTLVPPISLLQRTRALVEGVPANICLAEQAVVALVLARMIATIVELANLNGDLEIGRSALRITRLMLSSAWRSEVARHVEICARRVRAVGSDSGSGCLVSAAHDPVRSTLQIIDQDYANPGLGINAVAKAIGRSPCHLSHLLKSRTNASFRLYLRARRMAAATLLMGDSSIAIKEIVVRVGYKTRRQFERDFKCVFDTVASRFRRQCLGGRGSLVPR